MKKIFATIVWVALSQISGYAGVTVYQDINYKGTSTKYAVGNHNYNEIKKKAPGDDAISSVRIDPGYRIILYWDPNYKGRSLMLAKDTPNLALYGANDQTSSLRVEKIPVDGNLKGWAEPSYTGKSVTWKAGEYKDISDNFASVFVPKGFSVTLFSKTNFSGNVIAIHAENNDVWIDNFASICSSIRSLVIEKIEKSDEPKSNA